MQMIFMQFAGEFSYKLEGPDPPHENRVAFDPPFMFSSPTKKIHGQMFVFV